MSDDDDDDDGSWDSDSYLKHRYDSDSSSDNVKPTKLHFNNTEQDGVENVSNDEESENDQQFDPFAVMRQYMAMLQERADKEASDPIIDGPEYHLCGSASMGMVQNGQRYTKSEIVNDIDFQSILVVPENAKIIEKGSGNIIETVEMEKALIRGFAENHKIKLIDNLNQIILKYYHESIIEMYIEKSLGFYGHPPASIDIRVCHKNMGIASHKKDGKLFVGTFGEWNNMEGAATVNLLFLIPKHIKYEKHNYSVDGEGEMYGGWWYGASNCDKKWNKIKEEPDHQHYYKMHSE